MAFRRYGLVNIPTGFAWSDITGTPTTLAGYGITDGVISSRTLTINGTTYDLTANRTWAVGTITSITASSPLTGGIITSSGSIGITQANITTSGYLSSTDWNTFNGKFTLPSLTSGSVIFSNGTTLSQNNSNFFWDNANQRLGIGTATPSAIFHSVGTVSSASLIGRGAYFNNTITATANNDVLVGVDINPTFTNGAFTGVSNYGARISNQIKLNGYTTTSSYSGTVVGYLAFDANGNILTTAAPSGGSMAIGGSITSATVGSVLFAGVSGVLQQDNANFFWDDTNNRLGIGISSPSYKLSIGANAKGFDEYQSGTTANDAIKIIANNLGAVVAIQNNNASGFSGIEYYNNSSAGKVFTGFNNTNGQEFRFNNFATGGYIDFLISSTSSFKIFNSRNVGIGQTTDAGFKADINGTLRVTGNITTNTTLGSVLFAGTGGILSQDNTNFFWDNSNKRLGIGTITPANDLHIKKSGDTGGKFETTSSANEAFIVLQNNSSEQANLEIFGSTFPGVTLRNSSSFTTTCANGFAFLINTNSATSNFSIKTTTSLTERFRLFNSTGNVVIQSGGTFTDAGYRLDVTGTSHLNGSSTFGTLGSGTGMFWDNTNNRLLINTSTAIASEPLQVNGNIGAVGTFVGGGTNKSVVESSGYLVNGTNTTPILNLDGQWNSATANPTAIFLNITNTASGANAKLIDLQIGSATKFNVAKDGSVSLGSYGTGTITSLLSTTYNLSVDSAGKVVETAIPTIPTATSGTYTPTVSSTSNATVTNIQVAQYMRVGNVVTVSGRMTVASGNTISSYYLIMNVPITRDFTSATYACAGTAVRSVVSTANPAWITGEGSSTIRIHFPITATSTATDIHYHFTYSIPSA